MTVPVRRTVERSFTCVRKQRRQAIEREAPCREGAEVEARSGASSPAFTRNPSLIHLTTAFERFDDKRKQLEAPLVPLALQRLKDNVSRDVLELRKPSVFLENGI